MDFFPARDTSMTSGLDHPQGQAKRISNERQMIAKLDPAELQDRYLRLYDDHQVLKSHARKQEDKIKKLATKLTRVIEDKKKSDALPLGVKAAARDSETENLLAEYQNKISELREQNKILRQRVALAQQQVQAAQQMKKSSTMYENIPSKIDTGQPKRLPSPLLHNVRVIGPRDSARISGTTPRINASLLEDARMTNKQLEDSLEKAHQQLIEYEKQIEHLRQQLQQRDNEYDQNLLRLKAQAAGGDSRTNLQENIDMIRLQRDLRDKSDELRRLQTQCTNFESQNRSLQVTNAELLKEIDRLDRQIKDEQQRTVDLRSELRNSSRSTTMIHELNARNKDLERECDILKETNTKLMNSAFNADREAEFREKERALRLQIAQLEATIKADLNERGSLLDKLTLEKGANRKTDEEHRSMHLRYLEMKEKYDDLAEKMRFFEREGDINMKEIEEALIILRQRKERREPNFDFLIKVDDEKSQNLNKRILELESQLAESVHELEKTRNLLIMQYKINKDYKVEVDCVQRKMDENQAEFNSREVESSKLLDVRAGRIRNLQKDLEDIRYGTRQYPIRDQPTTDGEMHDRLIEDAVELERGQNLIEIHLSRASFNQRAIEFFGKNNEPSTFCSIEFFEHELQMTPIVKGVIPEYDFTAQYIVNVDDFLLYYLQREYTLIELHRTIGQSFQTLAACKLNLKQLIESPQGRLHGTAPIVSVHQANVDIGTFGVIEYWVRLRVPMQQAFRLLKERMKAQGYLITTSRSMKTSDETQKPHDGEPNMNELTIAILNCANVKAATPDHQPDLYCVYKFYDFDDHVTTTIPSSNNPNFEDREQYPVQMDFDLDRYLKNSQLQIFVFDDQDPRTDHYVATAVIPLIPLAHEDQIRGTFELKNDHGENNGTINVALKWTYSYLPPSASTRTKAQRLRNTPTSPREPLALLPDESISGHRTIAEKQKELNVKLKSRDVIKPDYQPKSKSDRPTSSSGGPISSVSQPVRNGYRDPHHQRTSSASSVTSKRVSFDNRDEIGTPNRLQNEDQSIADDDNRISPESSSETETPRNGTKQNIDDSETDIVYQRSSSAAKKLDDIVTIGIHDLILNENCPVFDNDDCEKVFVSVEFLDYPPENLETPYALGKGEPNTKYSFNFQRDCSTQDQVKKQQLAELVGSDGSGEIKFIVVGEPPENQPDLECVDVGYATVNAKQLLRDESDLVEHNIDVRGMDDDNQVIGQMNVTVRIVDALKKAQKYEKNHRRIQH